jgi:hypothetical protein
MQILVVLMTIEKSNQIIKVLIKLKELLTKFLQSKGVRFRIFFKELINLKGFLISPPAFPSRYF